MVIVSSTLDAYYAYAPHFKHTLTHDFLIFFNTQHMCLFSHTAPYILPFARLVKVRAVWFSGTYHQCTQLATAVPCAG